MIQSVIAENCFSAQTNGNKNHSTSSLIYLIGSFRFSDSTFSSRLSDASVTTLTDATSTLKQQSLEKQAEDTTVNIKKRSLTTLVEDVPQDVKYETEVP